MNNLNQEMQKTLREYLIRNHPEETLRATIFGTEHVNLLLQILLGPLFALGMQHNCYIGLTERRVLLIPLKGKKNKPSPDVSVIHLGRINKIEYNQGIMNGELKIHYGDGIKRFIDISRGYFENAEKFHRTFSQLPKVEINDEELRRSAKTEIKYKQKIRNKIRKSILIWAGLAVLILFIYLL